MIFLKVLVLAAVVAAEQVRYDGYQVIRVVPRSEQQLSELRKLQLHPHGLDFWTIAGRINAPVDISIPPESIYQFDSWTRVRGLEKFVLIDDLQHVIDAERSKAAEIPQPGTFDWEDYYDLDVIYAWLQNLTQLYPSVVSPIVGGTSYEGKPIYGVHISFKRGNPGVFIESGIHAREWITEATTTWILNQILHSSDPVVRSITQQYDWYIFPCINPDGYQYSHTTNRMWRKTRTPSAISPCYGVDLNRNWDNHWNEGGASSNPCDETYAGTGPFSTVETWTLSNTINDLGPVLQVYFCIHSYSQLLMIPYGHYFQNASNKDLLMDIGNKAAVSLAQRYGTIYKVGTIADAIYISTGGSMDWAKSEVGIPFTFEWELRDTGRHGFLLPPEQIVPTAEETLDSMVTILQEALPIIRSNLNLKNNFVTLNNEHYTNDYA